MKDLFLLDPDVVFLNHGSYGATPRPVFEAFQRYQRELERNPVEFLGRRLPELIHTARLRLAGYVGADAEGLVFVPNATAALNVVARSLRLAPGDEVLASDREYGAIDILWRFVCERAGARYVTAAPDRLWDSVGERTRVLCVSHVSSLTAEILPVDELCRRARAAGVLAVVDGAHGPGQLPLRLDELGADAYAGNCHKWMCAPKGAGFLWAAPALRDRLEPLVVSWDWERERTFAARHRGQGTRDPSAWLAVPDAIDFLEAHDWGAVRARCHALAGEAQRSIADLYGLAPPSGPFAQMSSAVLPPCDPDELQRRLREDHSIEVVCRQWAGKPLIRASFHAYNDEGDLGRLLEALVAYESLTSPP